MQAQAKAAPHAKAWEMTSASKRKLSLRSVKAKADARAARRIDRHRAGIMSTPEGRFIFGREWTPEDMDAFKAEYKRVDGFYFNRIGTAH